MYTTLSKIRAHCPCQNGWEKLLEYLGKTKADDEPLSFKTILKSNGLDDALWCCRAAPEYDKEWRLFAVWCARQVQHLTEDRRSLDALDIVERYANGEATDQELKAARAAAREVTGKVSGAAAWAAAWAVTWTCEVEAAKGVIQAAREAVCAAARGATNMMAEEVAWKATREATREEFRRLVEKA